MRAGVDSARAICWPPFSFIKLALIGFLDEPRARIDAFPVGELYDEIIRRGTANFSDMLLKSSLLFTTFHMTREAKPMLILVRSTLRRAVMLSPQVCELR